MRYERIKNGVFIARPNRFIAQVEIDGVVCNCHVKNTGRLGELLKKGARVFVQESDNPERKTKYDLISVYKGERLVNIDSQAPNKVFGEWAHNMFENVTMIKPECKYKNSRFDFYIEADGKKIFVEVKGVTLENNGVVMFPDAPTERGLKHINELCDCVANGYEAYVVFVIKIDGANCFTPNYTTHPEFAEALKKAEQKGVNIIAVQCDVTKDTLAIKKYVKVVYN